MFGKIQVGLSSPPDRDTLVADLLIDGHQLAEVRKESGEYRIELYARRDATAWDIAAADLVSALRAAIDYLGA